MQQLERQVKELEEVIRRRFPNSLSALILASGRMAEKEGRYEGRRGGWPLTVAVVVVMMK